MESILKDNQQWIDETWDKITVKLRRVSVQAKDKLPLRTKDGVYDDHSEGEDSTSWTNGFWPGIMWLMYASTGEECFRETAEICEEKLDTAFDYYTLLHHDVGFMWHISAGANYRLTGNEKSKNRNLHAAAILAARYNVNGEFIKAWNGENAPGWVIIDSMMNIPLLYWAGKETNNIAFRQMADAHAEKLLKYHIRPDGSAYHVVEYDTETGEVLSYPWTQGYDKVNSSWSRGQSWAIYGFVLAYLHTNKQSYLDMAKNAAHYFISNVCSTGYIPKLDFRQPDEPDYIDTSAGVIAACGLIEIAKAVPDFEKKMYLQSAINILKAVTDNYCDWSEEEQSILQMASGSYIRDIHLPAVYGEYYLVEAMYKLKGFEPLFW